MRGVTEAVLVLLLVLCAGNANVEGEVVVLQTVYRTTAALLQFTSPQYICLTYIPVTL